MITWATLALLITAAPIFAWRHGISTEKKKRRRRHAGGGQPPAGGRGDRVPPQRPGEAADQTMQIALGGRKK